MEQMECNPCYDETNFYETVNPSRVGTSRIDEDKDSSKAGKRTFIEQKWIIISLIIVVSLQALSLVTIFVLVGYFHSNTGSNVWKEANISLSQQLSSSLEQETYQQSRAGDVPAV